MVAWLIEMKCFSNMTRNDKMCTASERTEEGSPPSLPFPERTLIEFLLLLLLLKKRS